MAMIAGATARKALASYQLGSDIIEMKNNPASFSAILGTVAPWGLPIRTVARTGGWHHAQSLL